MDQVKSIGSYAVYFKSALEVLVIVGLFSFKRQLVDLIREDDSHQLRQHSVADTKMLWKQIDEVETAI